MGLLIATFFMFLIAIALKETKTQETSQSLDTIQLLKFKSICLAKLPLGCVSTPTRLSFRPNRKKDSEPRPLAWETPVARENHFEKP